MPLFSVSKKQVKMALAAIIVSALLGVSLASSPNYPPSSFAFPGFSSPARSVCRPVPSTLSLCHGIGYRQMRIPNLLGHDSLKEAQQQSAAWLPLVSKMCHRDTKKFLCSLFAPVCLPELSGPVNPCRGLCEAVRDGCLPVMSAFGFPWPEMFNCSRFPAGTNLCIPATGELEARSGEEVRQEEASKGTVMCDSCSLTAEGETDIQENFCHSPYAFKMRLGSVSVVGGDRQLVPHARSRILRWAGGGAERAEGVGGAMAHSALWLQDGATCTCPGLDVPVEEENGDVPVRGTEAGRRGLGGHQGVWFLGLAQAEEGRLVLTRLVRWTKEDRELKRFMRALLKHTCSEL